MKIGIVCPYKLSAPGGVQEHVRASAEILQSRGHEVVIISPDKEPISPLGHLMLGQAVKFPTPNKSWGFVSASLDLDAEKIARILQQYHFDIVHFHEPFVPFLSWQILEAVSVPAVATFHSEWRLSGQKKLKESFLPVIKPLMQKAQKKLCGVIAVSEVARQNWQEFFDTFSLNKVIPNGVDLERFSLQSPPLRIFGDHPTILFLGRIEKRKGLSFLLRSFALIQEEMPEVRLVVAGGGPLRRRYSAWVKRQSFGDKVYFSGRIPSEAVPGFYRGADVYCSPAIEGESFGIVLLEAMASGTPVTAFANPGYAELLSDSPYTELLQPVGEIEGLARILLKILKDNSFSEDISQWGLLKSKKYSWQEVGCQIEEFYSEALSVSS